MSRGGDIGTVGFIGLGQMGSPIAARLAAEGIDLVVHDLEPRAVESFTARTGARAAASAAEVVAASDALITMLPDGDAVRAVLRDAGGPSLGGLTALGEAPLVIDMSSSDPHATVASATALADAHIALVDAPVSGGVSRAVDGTLTILLGGEDRHVARARAILAPAGSSLVHVGPVGAAHALKALNNVMSASGLLLAAETMLVGARFGLRPSTMLEVLNASTGRNHATETKIAPYVLSGSYDSGFRADLMLKDLHIALGVGRGTRSPMPIASLVTSLWSLATDALPQGADQMEVVRFLEDTLRTSLSTAEDPDAA